MDRLIHGFIKIEKSMQILAVVGLVLFVGYLGAMNYRHHLTPSPSITSPTTQK
jgi:hypothetical protein